MTNASDQVNEEEWADYLSGVLKRLAELSGQMPPEAPVQELIEDACQPLAVLTGYLAGGIKDDAGGEGPLENLA